MQLQFTKGEIITLQVTCNSAKRDIVKIDDHYKIKLKSLPLKGKANRELIDYFKEIGYRTEIVKGEKSSTKVLKVLDIYK